MMGASAKSLVLGAVTFTLLVLAGCGEKPARKAQRNKPIAPITFATSFPMRSVWRAPCPAHPVTSFDVQDCELRALHAVHRQLNFTIASLWRTLDSPLGRTKFRASEAAWRSYAKLSCDVRAKVWPASGQSPSYAGGSETPAVFVTCEVDLSRAYLGHLRRMYDALKPR